jgi:glycosyltransferase involved in cell wall biosynthesis
MKLVIIIPCLNEEETLPLVFSTMPKEIAGVDIIEILIIDDGSTDKTVEVAKKLGVTHFIHHPQRRGLAFSLRDGLRGALEMGADIIVLTDGDNQYPQERIPDLIDPILKGEADTVIADRQVHQVKDFSPVKKFLQRLGTTVMNLAAGTNIPDGTSGFRAFSKEAAIKVNLVGKFNFAMEMTMQQSHKHLAIAFIKIKTNPKTRESRLFKNNWEHVRKSAVALINAFIMYQPLMVFSCLGVVLFIAGLIPFIHFIILYITTRSPFGPHHLQTLIIGTVLLNASFISFTLGVVANLVGINRSLLENVLEEERRERYNLQVEELSDK